MAIIVRPVTYTGALQRLVVNEQIAGIATVALWGGGGGGGGADSNPGGNGSGSGYATKTFSITAGDIIDVAVGGGGGGGATMGGGVPGYGGNAGASYVPGGSNLVFSSINPPSGQPPVYQVTNSRYTSFLNQYGVWDSPGGYTYYFDRTYTFNAPAPGNYQIISSCDNYGYVYIDGNLVLNVPDFNTNYQTILFLAAGFHTVRTIGYNTGGPASMGTTITAVALSSSYSGGTGGNAGYAGISGAGGGSGGATVVFKNGIEIAIAGGGGGGGGGGRFSQGGSAPDSGRAAPGTNAGQNGGTNPYDGGGGGAGGGGYGAGNGAPAGGGDNGAPGGGTGGNLGDSTAEPAGQYPGGSGSYGAAGVGGRGAVRGVYAAGAGVNGQVVFTFDLNGLFVKNIGSWQPVKKVYWKNSGNWQTVKDIWIKQNGIWKLANASDSNAPYFQNISGNFGVGSRP